MKTLRLFFVVVALLFPVVSHAQFGGYPTYPTQACATCVLTTGSYSNPAWILSLPASKLTAGTLSGFTLAAPTLTGTIAGTPTWGSGQTFPSVTATAGTGTQTGLTPVSVFKNVTPVASVTTGETDGQVYTMPGNTLAADGQMLSCHAGFVHAANTNSATYKFYFNGALAANVARAVSGEQEYINVDLIRSSSTFTRMVFVGAENGTAVVTASGAGSVDFTSPIIVKTTVTGATANADLTAMYMRCEWWP